MMPTKALSTSSVTSDQSKGRQATNLFRAAYDKATLDTKRAQTLNENPAFPRALLRLIEEHSAPAIPVVTPDGGRVHIVRVPVNPARSWKDAVCVLPNSEWGGFHHPISDAADAYVPIEGDIEQQEIILVNFGVKIANGQIALDWARAQRLRPAGPREVFAVCEHKISLHLTLGVDFLQVFSTVLCQKYHFSGKTTYSPAAMWSGARRWAALVEFDCEHENRRCWFAFVR